MNIQELKEMKGDIYSLLDENPHFTKGDIISHFGLPISSSKDTLSHPLSLIIWAWNNKNGRDGFYHLTPSHLL